MTAFPVNPSTSAPAHNRAQCISGFQACESGSEGSGADSGISIFQQHDRLTLPSKFWPTSSLLATALRSRPCQVTTQKSE